MSEALRVLHVTNAPFTIRQFLDGQTAYMRDHGVELHIATRFEGLQGDYDSDGIQATHSVPILRDLSPGADLLAVFLLRKLIRQIRPDIVHGHTPKGGLIAMLAASITGVRSIYHCRGLPFSTATGVKRVMLKTTERVSLGLADRVLCISASMRDAILEEQLCDPAKITIPGPGGSGNGIDSVRFDPARWPGARESMRDRQGIPRDALVVGFVGRLIREKGIHELAAAFDALKDAYPSLHLFIVGPFDERDPISPAVREALTTSPRVHLAGYVSEMPACYAAMDVLAFPTYREGFGAVALEAGAMGVPVVANRVTGCVDSIRDGVTGVLVEPRSVPALTVALEAYLADPELRRRHGIAARRHVLDSYRPELIWADILAAYRNLAGRR